MSDGGTEDLFANRRRPPGLDLMPVIEAVQAGAAAAIVKLAACKDSHESRLTSIDIAAHRHANIYEHQNLCTNLRYMINVREVPGL